MELNTKLQMTDGGTVRSNNDHTEFPISELPIEIILKIFSYLPMRDIKEVSLVCTNWYSIVQHPLLGKRFLFTIPENYMDIKLTRLFRNIRFENRKLDSSFPDFPFENKIQYLEFNKCKFYSINNFISILERAKYLKTLKIGDCEFNEIPENMLIFPACSSLENIKEFSIIHYSSLSRNDTNTHVFKLLSLVLLNLEKLHVELPNCWHTKHTWNGLDTKVDSEENETIIKYISKISSTLKHLAIPCLDDLYLIKQLSDIPNLQLLSLTIRRTNDDIILLLQKHKCLTSLEIDLTCSDGPNDHLFPFICNNLGNLKLLASWEHMREMTDDIWKLKQLETLTLNMRYVSKKSMEMVLLREKNEKLKSLSMRCLQYNVISEIAQKFQNLRILEVELHGNSYLTNKDIQMICRNLRWLTELSISVYKASKITDYAFTGIPETSDEAVGYSISELKGLTVLSFSTCKTNKLSKKILTEIIKLKELVRLQIRTINAKPEDILLLKVCKGLQYLLIKISKNHYVFYERDLLKEFRRCFAEPKYLYIQKDFFNFYSNPDLRWTCENESDHSEDLEIENVFV